MPIPGTTPVTAVIAPSDPLDAYPTHDEKYGKGGYRTVTSEADRVALFDSLRTDGMLVFVRETGKRYQLEPDLVTWIETLQTVSSELITLLNGKADETAVTAEASTRSVADALLQTQISDVSSSVATETSARLAEVSSVRGGGLNDGSVSSSKLKTTSDADKVQLANLSDAIVNSLAGGLDPAQYLGQITSVGQALESAATSSGKWYHVVVSGTLSGTNAPIIAVVSGDRLLSNGVAWQKYSAPPVFLADGAVTTTKLAGKSIITSKMGDGAIQLRHLSETLAEGVARDFVSNPGEAATGFVTDDGGVALGVDQDGRLMFDGHRYKAEELGKIFPDATTDLKWGVVELNVDGTHRLIIGVSDGGDVYGPHGRIGGDVLMARSGAGFDVVADPPNSVVNITENGDGSAFQFFAKRESLWLPFRAGKSGNGVRPHYVPADINHIIFYGQSNATREGNEAGSNNAITTTPSSRHLMFNAYTIGSWVESGLLAPTTSGNSTTYQAGLITGFQALYEGLGVADKGETMCSGCCATLDARFGWKCLASVPAVPGYSIDQLVSGQFPYSNLIYQVERGKALAAAQGCTYKVPAVVFIQGEADPDDASWKDKFTALALSLNLSIKAASGQVEDVVFIIEQMNRPIWSTAHVVDLQILAAHHSAGGQVYWQSPRYHIDMGQHYYPHQKRWRGCHIGETLAGILGSDNEWEGLYCSSYSIAGNDLFLRFEVPRPPLVFATSENVTSLLSLYGFEALDLVSVGIVSDKVLRLVNSTGWSGKTLKYARQAGLDSQKGNLGDSDPTIAVYSDALGNPYSLRNWCAAFEISFP